jgi:hypothetical protein
MHSALHCSHFGSVNHPAKNPYPTLILYQHPVQDIARLDASLRGCHFQMNGYKDKEGILKFEVHMKPNQQIKYLNTGSTHTQRLFQGNHEWSLLPPNQAHHSQQEQ